MNNDNRDFNLLEEIQNNDKTLIAILKDTIADVRRENQFKTHIIIILLSLLLIFGASIVFYIISLSS
jgi:hypothetical protein